MTTQIVKVVLVGAIFGLALFFSPFFVLKVLVFLLIAGFLIRMFSRRRGFGPYGWAFADRIRQMSDQEYQQYKDSRGQHCRDFSKKAEDQNAKGEEDETK